MPINPVNIIQGPAIITLNGYTYYTKGDISVRLSRTTFNIETSMYGKIDERLKSQMTEISFQPVGEIESMDKYFPYGVANIGASIFTAVDKPCVIKTLDGKVITWARGAISKMPPLRLKATDTLFGDMSIMCIGKSNTALTNAAAFKAITAAAFSDATFDETKIATAHYTAAYGGSPYDVMESKDGFEVDVSMETESNEVDAYGLVDVYLKSLSVGARFTPIGLTEAQIDTLMALQDAAAILPGESLSKADTDLVITGAPLVVTIPNAGPKNNEIDYGLGKNRLGQIEFMNRRTWTAGVADALLTLEIPD